MPLQKHIECLKSLALRSIACNMKNLWCRDYIQNFANQGFFMYIIGPFDYLSEYYYVLCCIDTHVVYANIVWGTHGNALAEWLTCRFFGSVGRRFKIPAVPLFQCVIHNLE